jgi:hypothetical protein
MILRKQKKRNPYCHLVTWSWTSFVLVVGVNSLYIPNSKKFKKFKKEKKETLPSSSSPGDVAIKVFMVVIHGSRWHHHSDMAIKVHLPSTVIVGIAICCHRWSSNVALAPVDGAERWLEVEVASGGVDGGIVVAFLSMAEWVLKRVNESKRRGGERRRGSD